MSRRGRRIPREEMSPIPTVKTLFGSDGGLAGAGDSSGNSCCSNLHYKKKQNIENTIRYF